MQEAYFYENPLTKMDKFKIPKPYYDIVLPSGYLTPKITLEIQINLIKPSQNELALSLWGTYFC